MVMGADSCLFECANPNQQLSRPMTSTSPGAAVDDLGKRLHAALLSSRPTGSFRPTPPPRLLHHILGRALANLVIDDGGAEIGTACDLQGKRKLARSDDVGASGRQRLDDIDRDERFILKHED